MLRRKKKHQSAPADGADQATVAVTPAEAAPGDATDAGTTTEGDAGAAPVATANGSDPVVRGHANPADPEGPAPGSSDGAQQGDAAIAIAEAEPPPSQPEPGRAPGPGYDDTSDFEDRLPVSFWVQSVQSVLTKTGAPGRDELERQAEQDFRSAIAPGLQGLHEAVPDASSPDDALRVLAEREAEYDYPEDPEAASLTQRDIFGTDSSVYYRIRNRFEKPRRRVGWGDPWRPPPGLAKPDPPHRALNRPD